MLSFYGVLVQKLDFFKIFVIMYNVCLCRQVFVTV